MRATRTGRAARIESRLLRAIAVGSWLTAAFIAALTTVRLTRILTESVLRFDDIAVYAPGTSPSFLEEHENIVAAQYDSAWLEVSAVPQHIRLLAAAAILLGAALGVGICICIAVLAGRVRTGRPFVRAATWAIGTSAILVVVSGMVAPFMRALTQAELVRFLGDAVLATARDTGFGRDGLLVFGVTVSAAPIGWAIALAVVAAAFEAGQRLQRDTDGLV